MTTNGAGTEVGTVGWAAVRAPDLDSRCDAPSVRPAWRVTRNGVLICIAETTNEMTAISIGMNELRARAARGELVSAAVSMGPAIAPRSLATQARSLLLIASEVHELAVARFIQSCDEGWPSDAHAAAKAEVERAANLLDEARYLAQIVEQLPSSVRDGERNLAAVSS